MIYQKLIETQNIIRDLLKIKGNLAFITEIIDKNKDYVDLRVAEFLKSLRYIQTITKDEILNYENDVFSSITILEEIFQFVKDIDRYSIERKCDEASLVTRIINFDNNIYEIKKFIDGYRLNRKQSEVLKYQIEEEIDEIKRAIVAVKNNKEEIDRILKQIIVSKNESSDTLSRLHNTELRIGELEKDINKQKTYIDSILVKAEAFKESFDNQFEAIALRREKLQSLLDSIEIDLKNSMGNRLNAIDKDLEVSIRKFNGKFQSLMANQEEAFQKEKEELFESIQGQHNLIINEISLFRTKILNDLHDVESAVYREQLARYFYDERRKLKGDVSVNLILAAFVLFVVFWRQELLAEYILDADVIWRLPVSFFTSMIVTQVLFNMYEHRNTICKLVRSFRKTTSQDVHDNKLADNTNADLEKNIAKGNLLENLLFQKQIKDLLTPYWCWLIATFTGMLSIANLAIIIFHRFKDVAVTYNDFLPYTAGYMLLIWFTWFCSKQFSYTKQICDEYEYKYALSKSYVSYREEARKLADAKHDVAILIALLDSVIKNIAQSPVQNVKRDCHTPFTEVFNAVKDANDSLNKSSNKGNDN